MCLCVGAITRVRMDCELLCVGAITRVRMDCELPEEFEVIVGMCHGSVMSLYEEH